MSIWKEKPTKSVKIYEIFDAWFDITYCTCANKGRAQYSKNLVLVLRLSDCVFAWFLRGAVTNQERPLLAQVLYLINNFQENFALTMMHWKWFRLWRFCGPIYEKTSVQNSQKPLPLHPSLPNLGDKLALSRSGRKMNVEVCCKKFIGQNFTKIQWSLIDLDFILVIWIPK